MLTTFFPRCAFTSPINCRFHLCIIRITTTECKIITQRRKDAASSPDDQEETRRLGFHLPEIQVNDLSFNVIFKRSFNIPIASTVRRKYPIQSLFQQLEPPHWRVPPVTNELLKPTVNRLQRFRWRNVLTAKLTWLIIILCHIIAWKIVYARPFLTKKKRNES